MLDNHTSFFSSTQVILYHGSKNGIKGNIKPCSRTHCDFGAGFYMSPEKTQPLSLICGFPTSRLYKLQLNISQLKTLQIDIGYEWMFLIAYNRGYLELYGDTELYHKYKHKLDNIDLAVGHIADDRMFVVLERFFKNEITDTALLNCLSALDLGKQFVALTAKSCDAINILEEEVLSKQVRDQHKILSDSNRVKGSSLATEICKKYRRVGKYFDEIIEEGVSE